MVSKQWALDDGRHDALRNTLRTVVGWIFLTIFFFTVTTWTSFGFAPALANVAPEPLAAFGRISESWPILVGAIAATLAIWALAPTFRFGSESVGGGEAGLSPLGVAILGPTSLLMMFASYWPCAGDESSVWSSLRRALEAFEGYAPEPFGSVVGCPAEFPQGLLAGILFGKATLLLVLGIGLAYVFRHSIDEFHARFSKQIVVLSGIDAHTMDVVRWVGDHRNFSRHQRLVILDAGPDLIQAQELARDIRKSAKVTVLTLDVSDNGAITAFMQRRGRKGIQGLYLLSPDSSMNLTAMKVFLDSHERHTSGVHRSEIPGRVVVRVDNPWHAEDWRRQQMSSRPEWLFDAVSALETSARHVVTRLKEHVPPIDRVVISGSSPFELAVLSGLAFEHRVDDFLERTSIAAKTRWEKENTAETPYHSYSKSTPNAVLVGTQGKLVAEHFQDQLRRFGMHNSEEILEICVDEDREQAMVRLLDDGHTPALVMDGTSKAGSDSDSTFLAVRNPQWIIFSWDLNTRGTTEKPLLGNFSVVGPTTKPVPGFGMDIWDRLGALQHRAYLLNFCGGLEDSEDETKKRGLWEDLSSFARESNIRSFSTFLRVVGGLARQRQLGTDLGPKGTESPAPLDDPAEIEEVAEREHESWVNHHREYGYRFGLEKKGKRHPDIVDWSILNEPERLKDVENVRATNDLLRSLGFILADVP